MKNFMNKVMATLNNAMVQTGSYVNKHKKVISFSYLFAMLMSCLGVTAFATEPTPAATADAYPLWQTTDAVLDIIFPIIVVVGVIMVIVGVILFFISRFNEQAVTGPLIILAIGIGLVLIRALLGNTISWIAFQQMYPDSGLTKDTWSGLF